MLNTGTEKGLIPNTEINSYFRITEGDAGLFIAAFATTEEDEEAAEENIDSELIAGKLKVTGKTNPIQFLGSTVFKEGQMIGKLTVEENRLVQLVIVAFEKPSFLASIKDPFNPDYWFLNHPQWEEYDWMGSYLDADVDIQVDIRFGEFGRQGELPLIQRCVINT